MTDNRLADYLDHMRQAATDACSFVEDITKTHFWSINVLNKRSS